MDGSSTIALMLMCKYMQASSGLKFQKSFPRVRLKAASLIKTDTAKRLSVIRER